MMRIALLFFLSCSLIVNAMPASAQCRGKAGIGRGKGGAPIGEEMGSRILHRNMLANLGRSIVTGSFPLRSPVPELIPQQKKVLKQISNKLPAESKERSQLDSLAGRLSARHFKALAIYFDRKYPNQEKSPPFKPQRDQF